MTAKTKEPDFRFELGGEVLELSMDALTFGEVEFIESYFNAGLGEIDFNTGRGMLVVAYVAKQRIDPTVTLDDLRDVKVSSLKEAPKPKRPTKAKPETAGSPS